MKSIDKDLLEQVIGRAAMQHAAEQLPGAYPGVIDAKAHDYTLRGWFRSIVSAAVDAYRHAQELAGEQPAALATGLADFERMGLGRQALEALRRYGFRDDEVALAWVVPDDFLRGYTKAYGLPIVRSPGLARPHLAIQWDPKPVRTHSDEGSELA